MVPTVLDFSLKLRVASIFIIFFASILGVVLPLLFSACSGPVTEESHRKMLESEAFRIMRTFAAGIMLGVGFIHLLDDGASTLSAIILDYPALGYTLAAVGAMIVLAFEQVAVLLIQSVDMGCSAKSLVDTEKNIETDFGMAPGELGALEKRNNRDYDACEHNHAIKMIVDTESLNLIVKAYMMEISIAIHSVIIGIALGNMAGSSQLTTLEAFIVAICFHQFFEGLGLGTVIEAAKLHLGVTKVLVFAVMFAITVPAGIVIGILITGDVVVAIGDDATMIAEPDVNFRQEVTLGCLNSIAAGSDEIPKIGLDYINLG